MKSSLIKYIVIGIHFSLLAYLITSFVINEWFYFKCDKYSETLSMGLFKYCDNEKCKLYDEKSSKLYIIFP